MLPHSLSRSITFSSFTLSHHPQDSQLYRPLVFSSFSLSSALSFLLSLLFFRTHESYSRTGMPFQVNTAGLEHEKNIASRVRNSIACNQPTPHPECKVRENIARTTIHHACSMNSSLCSPQELSRMVLPLGAFSESLSSVRLGHDANRVSPQAQLRIFGTVPSTLTSPTVLTLEKLTLE